MELSQPTGVLRRMRWRLRSGFSILAWLALFVLQMPTPAWSCSMTGRVGDQTAICRGMPPGVTCCSRSGKPCCQPLSFPPLPYNSDDSRSQNIIALVHITETKTDTGKAARVSDQSFISAPLPVCRIISAVRINSLFSTAPPFLTLHRPASIASRAPPLSLLS